MNRNKRRTGHPECTILGCECRGDVMPGASAHVTPPYVNPYGHAACLCHPESEAQLRGVERFECEKAT